MIYLDQHTDPGEIARTPVASLAHNFTTIAIALVNRDGQPIIIDLSGLEEKTNES